MEKITAEIKTTRNNKLVAQVKIDDLAWAHEAYEDEQVEINGTVYRVTSVGNPFGRHGDVQVYLYIEDVAEEKGAYRLIANHDQVLCRGTEAEVQAEMDKINVVESPWYCLEIVAPGETAKL